MSELSLPRETRCVLVPAGTLRLLLPNASVAEVIMLPTPEPLTEVPAWLLGSIAWRGWQVPLLSFSKLTGTGEGDSELTPRVAVLKTLGGHASLPFIAIVTRGFPQLMTLNAEMVIPTYDSAPLPTGIKMQVLVHNETAVIPDLEDIERQLIEVLHSAPATD